MLLLLQMLGFGLVERAEALTLDWSTVTWTGGGLSAGFDIDPDNAGDDITITISGSTGFFQSGTPAINDRIITGQDALDLWLDFDKDNKSVVVTVTFNYSLGVSNASVTLFDVDRGPSSGKGSTYTFVDEISQIKATATNSSIVAATSVTTSTDNASSGSGTNIIVYGSGENPTDSSGGNVGISFGTNVISSFTFTYGNNSSSQKDPDQQWIGLFDITFTPKKIPEKGTTLALAGIGLGCVFFGYRFRRTALLKAASGAV